MNLKLSLIILLVGVLIGGGLVYKLKPDPVIAEQSEKKSGKIERIIERKGEIVREVEVYKSESESVSKPRDLFMVEGSSDIRLGVKVSPIEHLWIGYERDFKNNENIYKLGYSWGF